VQIFNPAGKMIYSTTIKNGNYRWDIPRTILPKGMYFLVVRDAARRKIIPFMISQ
jgi:hypothetical protein